MRSFLTNGALALASVVVASGIVAFADPANASVSARAPQAIVQTGDLDLGTPAGKHVARQRIADAAARVCAFGSSDPAKMLPCRAEAFARANHALGQQIAAR